MAIRSNFTTFAANIKLFVFLIMKVIKARKILKALRDDGWILKYQVGSHAQYIHPTKPGKVTINGTGNDDIYGNLLKSIEEQSGLKF